MSKGYEIELADGRVLQMVPNDGASNCSISHGDIMIEIDVGKGSFKVSKPLAVLNASVVAIARFEPKEFTISNPGKGDPSIKSEFHTMRNCTSCNGKTCCITNGCANCGCGFFCG